MQTVNITYTCDRCDKQYKNPITNYGFGFVDTKTKELKLKDLCPKCSNELLKWFMRDEDDEDDDDYDDLEQGLLNGTICGEPWDI